MQQQQASGRGRGGGSSGGSAQQHLHTHAAIQGRAADVHYATASQFAAAQGGSVGALAGASEPGAAGGGAGQQQQQAAARFQKVISRVESGAIKELDDAKVYSAILAYMERKGFDAAAAQAVAEGSTASAQSVAEYLVMETLEKNNRRAAQQVVQLLKSPEDASYYIAGYVKVEQFVHRTLDQFKNELLAVLYPLFVHTFFFLLENGHEAEAGQFMGRYKGQYQQRYAADLAELAAISRWEQRNGSELAKDYLQNRFRVWMSRFTFEFLIKFLSSPSNRKDTMMILYILNTKLEIEIFENRPETDDPTDAVARSGVALMKIDERAGTINRRKIRWGGLPEDEYVREEAVHRAESDGASRPAEGAAAHPVKKARTGDGANKPVEGVAVPILKIRDDTYKDALEELRHQVKLSDSSLPSICAFTVVNSYRTLNCLASAKDASVFAGGFDDSIIRVWDLQKSNAASAADEKAKGGGGGWKPPAQQVLRGHAGPVYGCAFTPDNRFLISCSEDKTARLWSLEHGSNLVCFRGHNYPVWDVDVAPFGHYFATAAHDRTARVWTMDRIAPVRLLAGHLSDVDCVRFHPNCHYVGTGSSDKTVRLWQLNKGSPVRLFTGHTGTVHALAFSPCGRYVLSAGEDSHIIMWDIGEGQAIATLKVPLHKGKVGAIWSVAFSECGRLISAGGADGTVRLWDAEAARKANGKEDVAPLKSFATKKTVVNSVQFTRRNLLMVGGYFDDASELPRTAVV